MLAGPIMKRGKPTRQRVVLRPAPPEAAARTTTYQMRHRLLRERVVALLSAPGLAAEDNPAGGRDRQADKQLVRLVGAALVLLERHQVDGAGRCGVCRRNGWPRRFRRRRQCSVFGVLSFFLDESLELVWRQVAAYETTKR